MTKYALRTATVHDVGFIYGLRNDVEARKHSESMAPVTAADIATWKALIYTMDDKAVGYGLCDEEDGMCRVLVVIAAPFRYRGHGRRLAEMLIKHAEGKTVWAQIRLTNKGGIRLAKSLKFEKLNDDKATSMQRWALDPVPATAV